MQAKLVANVHLLLSQQIKFGNHIEADFDEKIVDIFAKDYFKNESKCVNPNHIQLINDQKRNLI